ncbi:MAG TPA: hypothetical protein PK011_07080, partial [Marinagarivorans sp.]|nr:hypothetical protein [Marinagarivorans sp.]
TARANEALQASLLAPIGATPLAPGFAETAMQVLPGAGPHEMGINEYNAAFSPNGINGFVSALGAGNNTRATEGQVQLVGEKTDLSLGQYHYYSDGFRENNDRDYLVNEARLKYQVVDSLMIQFSALEREDDFGDLSDQIVSDEFINRTRRLNNKDIYSIGFNYDLGNSVYLMGYQSKGRVSRTDLSEIIFPWGDSTRAELPYVGKPEVTMVFGRFNSMFGDLVIGCKRIKIHENYRGTYTDVIDGVQQDPFFEELIPENNKIELCSADYQYLVDEFYAEFSFDSVDVDNLNFASLDDSFFSGEMGFNCFSEIECKLVHKEFLVSPVYGFEFLGVQTVDANYGRNDYQPFSSVKIDGAGVEGVWSTIALYGNFQRSNVSSPFYLARQTANPNFEEKQYTFGLTATPKWIDTLGFKFSLNESTSLYEAGALSKSNIPDLFRTEIYELSVNQAIWNDLVGNLSLSAIDQRYVIPKFGSEADFRSRVRFVNLDLSLKFEPCRLCEFQVYAINILDNNKKYIEGYLADFASAEQAASLEKYFTERVFALSVKVSY